MSVLNIEPHPFLLEGGYGQTTFWHISIDGSLLTDCAKPFSATEKEIVVRECNICGMCGDYEVSVRRCGSNIIWMANEENDRPTILDGGLFYLFDTADYEKAVGGNAGRLPEITREKIQDLLRQQPLPDPCSALYTIPDLPDDPSGKLFLYKILDAIRSPQSALNIVDAPSEYRSIRVGLETDDVSEWVVRIGKSQDVIAVKLAATPAIAAWVTSPLIDQSLRPIWDAVAPSRPHD